jgi:hypothetical protein
MADWLKMDQGHNGLGPFPSSFGRPIKAVSLDIRVMSDGVSVARWFGGNGLASPGRIFAMGGRLLIDGLTMTDNETGQRWRLKRGEWVACRPTRNPLGRERYERRCRNGR